MFDQLLLALALACVALPCGLISLVWLMGYAARHNVRLVPAGGGFDIMPLTSDRAREWVPTFQAKGLQLTIWWLSVALPVAVLFSL